MAGSVNKVIIIGRVGKDPEIRSTNTGNEIATFSLACSESWKDKNTGERKESTEWINVSVMNKGLVGLVKTTWKKDAQLYVEGKYSTRTWDKDGVKQYSTSVVLSGFGGSIVMLGGKGSDGNNSAPQEQAQVSNAVDDELDSEIPF